MSLALHYRMGDVHHCSGSTVSEMTCTVSSGTLKLYYSIPCTQQTFHLDLHRCCNDDFRSFLAGLALFIHTSSSVRTHHVDVVDLAKLLRLVIYLANIHAHQHSPNYCVLKMASNTAQPTNQPFLFAFSVVHLTTLKQNKKRWLVR